MKLKKKIKKYPTDSALENYKLKFILPEYILEQPYKITPFKKNFNFYMDTGNSWNNKFRAGPKSHQFYFQVKETAAETIQQRQNQQRNLKFQCQNQRIKILKSLRQDSLLRHLSQKYSRIQLQQNSSQKVYSDIDSIGKLQQQVRMKTAQKKKKSNEKSYITHFKIDDSLRDYRYLKQVQRDDENFRSIQELINQHQQKFRNEQQKRCLQRQTLNRLKTAKSTPKYLNKF